LRSRIGRRIRGLLSQFGYALTGITGIAFLVPDYLPPHWRAIPEHSESPLSLRFMALRERAGITVPIRLFTYRTFPLEGANASVGCDEHGYELLMSDHFRTAPAVAVDAMIAHELGHVARGDCLEQGEMGDMQAGADAFAMTLIGEVAYTEGIWYLAEHAGLDAYQADMLSLRMHNMREEALRKRLVRAKELLSAPVAPE
jgi:hypothetical protein